LRFTAGVDSNGYAGAAVQAPADGADALNLELGFGVDFADAVLQDQFELGFGFTRAREDHVGWLCTGGKRLVELAGGG
jgi:hypothetical protein